MGEVRSIVDLFLKKGHASGGQRPDADADLARHGLCSSTTGRDTGARR
jgi:hypothetical protein